MDDQTHESKLTPDPSRNQGKSTKSGTPVWLGGEFFDPSSPYSVPRDIAQRQFLLLASEMYSVTADLRDNVFPHFPSIGSSLDQEPLKNELKKWCDRHRLGQSWVLRQLADTFNIWKLDPELSGLHQDKPLWHPIFDVVYRRPRPETTDRFAFSYLGSNFTITADGVKNWSEPAGWYLELERKEEFEAEARRQFENALAEYCADQERKAEERGLIRVKRSRASKVTARSKMEWAVQRQCGRMSFEEIAQAHLGKTQQVVDISTVIKQVSEISRLIKLDY